MTMQQFDNNAILEATRPASREQALRLRELWRMQLRLLEEMHDLPRSFLTKAEQPNRDVSIKNGHHNR